jgi:hypothetical protein
MLFPPIPTPKKLASGAAGVRMRDTIFVTTLGRRMSCRMLATAL